LEVDLAHGLKGQLKQLQHSVADGLASEFEGAALARIAALCVASC
jgi:hypothetical protein